MLDDRRRLPTEPAPAVDRVSHEVLYPLLGFALGLGSPVGAFLLRWWLEDPVLPMAWARAEVDYNALFYWYMGLGTVSSFILFGWVIGRRSERQRVRNSALRRRLDELRLTSATDGLTGAYSHAFLQETLALELERSKRGQKPLSVLMLDLDDFKKINDTHGHLFGDRVLKEVTETVSMHVRQGDVLARYGGEEFVVVMPGAEGETALRVAERVRQAVNRTQVVDTSLDAGPGASVSVSLSIGIATFPGRGGQTTVDLLRHADANLYKAKRGGKNRTVAEGHPAKARSS